MYKEEKMDAGEHKGVHFWFSLKPRQAHSGGCVSPLACLPLSSEPHLDHLNLVLMGALRRAVPKVTTDLSVPPSHQKQWFNIVSWGLLFLFWRFFSKNPLES